MASYPGTVQAALGASMPLIIRAPTAPWGPLPLLGLVCTLSSGAVLTYTIQVTADPNPSPAGNWNNHDIIVGQTVSAVGNVAYPITGLRVNVTAYTSGSVSMGVAQWPG